MRHDRSGLGAVPAVWTGSPHKIRSHNIQAPGVKENPKKKKKNPSLYLAEGPKSLYSNPTKQAARFCLYTSSDRKLTTPQVSSCPLPLALGFKNFLLSSHTSVPYFPHSGTNLTLFQNDSPWPIIPVSASFQLNTPDLSNRPHKPSLEGRLPSWSVFCFTASKNNITPRSGPIWPSKRGLTVPSFQVPTSYGAAGGSNFCFF